MADDWIKMRASLDTDPDVIAIAAALKADVDTVIGKLFRFWKWADQQTASGNIPRINFAWIDAHIRCENFSESLKNVGWLSVTSDGIRVPKFTRHNGQSAKRRALTARRVAKHRDRKCNARGVTKVLPEKRREEKNREEIRTPLSPPTIFMRFPVRGGEWVLTQEKLEQYRESYPKIDIAGECRKARQWCQDRPAERLKTARGMPAFLGRWMQTAESDRLEREPHELDFRPPDAEELAILRTAEEAE